MFRQTIISLLAVSSWMSALEASSLLDNSYLSVSDDSARMCIKTSINVSSINNVSLENVDIKNCLSDVLELQLNDEDYGTLFEGGFKNLISKAPIFVCTDNTSKNLQYSEVKNGKQIFGLNLPLIKKAYDEEIDKSGWTLEKFIKSSMAHEMGHQYLLHYYSGLGEKYFKYGPVFCVQEAFATYSEILYALKKNSGVFPSGTKTFKDAMIHILTDLENDKPVETKYVLNARYLYCLCLCLDYNDDSLKFNYDILKKADTWALGNPTQGIKGDGTAVFLVGGGFDYNKFHDSKEVENLITEKISAIDKLKKAQKPIISSCLKRILGASAEIAAQGFPQNQ